jgi:hypothetical protein
VTHNWDAHARLITSLIAHENTLLTTSIDVARPLAIWDMVFVVRFFVVIFLRVIDVSLCGSPWPH